ncbi:MAG: US12 family protein [Planctomycetes bacterium]|nr:US12 family protein [Planctomycetota bacterium]
MSDANPYALDHLIAAEAPVAARLAFLKKTYGLLLLGVLGFAVTLWAAGNVESVSSLAQGLWRTSPWITLVVLIGGSWLVHAVSDKHPLNLVAYFTYVFFFGLLLAPLVLSVAHAAPVVLTQASLITAFVFTGLTGYVFVTRKDFSFLGGALAIGMFALLGVAIAGMAFGFSIGLWYSVAGVLLFSGYVLYDTSKVLHHYPTNRHVSAAIVLFVDVVLLFKHILLLLSRSRD